jgi:hypothetical protein
MDKTILLASFIFPERIDWFLGHLDKTFGIKGDGVFRYQNINDESKTILTYKVTVKEGEKLNFKKLFPNAIIIHKKGDALYTINALNKLIEKDFQDTLGNVDHKSIKIDWSKYQNKFILIDKNELAFLDIKRIFTNS